MSRYDDLRRMREAKFARIPATSPKTTEPAKQEPVTKNPITKKRTGRPPLGDKPMTPAERMRRYRTFKTTL
jgi:hypothetical protein